VDGEADIPRSGEVAHRDNTVCASVGGYARVCVQEEVAGLARSNVVRQRDGALGPRLERARRPQEITIALRLIYWICLRPKMGISPLTLSP